MIDHNLSNLNDIIWAEYSKEIFDIAVTETVIDMIKEQKLKEKNA